MNVIVEQLIVDSVVSAGLWLSRHSIHVVDSTIVITAEVAMRMSTLLLALWMALVEAQMDMSNFVLNQPPKRCHYERSHGMNGAVCYGLNLEAVPSNLKSNIEILDASYNRIRELYEKTFANYGYLKMLYLEDNMIMYVENGTFKHLQYLEVVDLSSNSLDAVPRELLTLPNLRKLYMNNNRLTSSAGFLNAPASQSLEFLSLARCHLPEFPPLAGYPFLKNVNLSGNELRTLSTQQLAPMCVLESLDLTGNPSLFKDRKQDGACDCIVVESWVASRGIHMPDGFKLNCSTNKYGGDTCINITYPEESVQVYESCVNEMRTREEIATSRMTWILVAVVITCSLLTIFLVLFWIHKRNKRKARGKTPEINDNEDIEEKMVSKYEIADS